MADALDLRDEGRLRARLPAWDFFVLRHRKPANLAVHFATFVLYCVSLAVAVAKWDYRWLLGCVAAGLIAAPAHWLFDDGGVNVHEATWDPRVPFFVAIMFWRMARGRYWEDVRQAEARYRELCGDREGTRSVGA